MGVLGRYGSNALKYYGSILASAYENKSTADMWTAIRDTQAQYGLPKPGASAPDVSVIRGYANRIVAGAQAFAAAGDTDTITSDMMAVAPYTSNDLNGIAVNPTYQVRYQVTWQTADGTVKSRWNTSVFTAANFPDTVGDLRAAIDFNAGELLAQAAQQVGGESGGTLLSTSDHEITLVLRDGRAGPLPQQQRQHVDAARGAHPRHRDPGHPGIPRDPGTAVLACPRRLPHGHPAAGRGARRRRRPHRHGPGPAGQQMGRPLGGNLGVRP